MNLIVINTGYLSIEQVLKLESYSIYKTHKGTHILMNWDKHIIKSDQYTQVSFYSPKRDRLPWKVTEGEKICNDVVKIFDSEQGAENIDFKGWNNGNQIMSYTHFSN